VCRLTPQFSGRALPCEARRERIMKWRARAVAATPYHGPLQLLVMRHTHADACKPRFGDSCDHRLALIPARRRAVQRVVMPALRCLIVVFRLYFIERADRVRELT